MSDVKPDNPAPPAEPASQDTPLPSREQGPKASEEPMLAGTVPAFSTVELFEQAVRTHSARLISIARAIVGNRASPEDVVQQAVMNLFKHRERYDWREPGGLLKRATINEALRLLRQPKMTSVPDEVETDRIQTPDDVAMASETVQKVRAAIATLPEHFRAALVLCEYENMSYAEIAETLNASVPQVKTWIHRARRKIEKQLAGYVGAEAEENEE
ncbi:MAG: sigma-70 family RNA polymerase sigma factor [Tepidisphaeraceae bacterium]